MKSQRGITADFRGFFVLTFRELSVAVVWSSDPCSALFSLRLSTNSSEPSEPEEESAAAFLFGVADAAAAPFAAAAAFLARATAPFTIQKRGRRNGCRGCLESRNFEF